MSIPAAANTAPITDKAQLVEHIAQGEKPKAAWRIGTEHEKFAFRWSDYRALPYEGPDGIRALLTALERFGWEPVKEGETVIGLKKNGASVSLEPGGQVELSGAPLETIHQTCDEVNTHLAEVKAVTEDLGVGLIGLGFQPKWAREDTPWMPKGRYKIMREYMPKRGDLGLDMMLRTCTIQVNLDYADEADMVRKFRVGLALQPIATALFANSPFTMGKPNGFAPACCPSSSRTASGTSGGSTTCSMCRCISFIGMAPISTPAASPSAISWTADCPPCRAKPR